ncbi:hypothetical protein ACLBXI_29735, partial [Bacillus cereus]
SDVDLFFDPSTERILKEELTKLKTQKDVTIYDVKLKKEMVLLIKPVLDVAAYRSGDHVCIKNTTDTSWYYSILKKLTQGATEVKRGILPPNSIMGTGYLVENESDILYISIGSRVDTETRVIFDKQASFLPKIDNKIPALSATGQVNPNPSKPILSGTWKGGGTVENGTLWPDNLYTDATYENGNLNISAKVGTKANSNSYTIMCSVLTDKITKNSNHYLGSGDMTFTHTDDTGHLGPIEVLDDTITVLFEKDSTTVSKLIANEHLGILKSFSSKLSNISTLNSELAVYSKGNQIVLFNKGPDITYTILNSAQQSIKKETIGSRKSISLDQNLFNSWWQGYYKDEPQVHKLIFTVHDVPCYNTSIDEVKKLDLGKDHTKKISDAHRLDYWHLDTIASLDNGKHSYDYVTFKPMEPLLVSALDSYEVKVGGTSLGKQVIRPFELDGKQVINFFDYTPDVSKHPTSGQQVEIIAYDLLGGSTTIFTGNAGSSEDIWKDHYTVSEWHKIDTCFDALYLSPIPTGLTEMVKSYDIKVGNHEMKSVQFERVNNGGYLREQRLKIDLAKYFSKEQLPKVGDSTVLTIHTLEDTTVLIDLGKVVEATSPGSINKLEEYHSINEWKKRNTAYQQVVFSKLSEEITSYVFKVNNRYYGEVPIGKNETLDFSSLNTKQPIQKGDYVEIYAYKKDGEAVLVQSRYAGTVGHLGEYPTKDRMQKECFITGWTKEKEQYTSFTLKDLSDQVDSYIKQYEVRINNNIVKITQANQNAFTFEPGKGPHRGDRVQIVAHTYTGEVVEIPEQLAGTIGDVTEKEITS